MTWNYRKTTSKMSGLEESKLHIMPMYAKNAITSSDVAPIFRENSFFEVRELHKAVRDLEED